MQSEQEVIRLLANDASARSAAAERVADRFDELQTPASTTPRAKDIRETRGTACASPRPNVRVPKYFLFSFGPCTARFLFSFWKEKRKWGVQ